MSIEMEKDLQLKPGFSGFGHTSDVATIDYEMDTSRLPISELTTIGGGINRWQPLFFDPQKNSIEPFRRIGDNSVLPFLDRQESQCFPVYKAQEQVQGTLRSSNQSS